MEKSLNLFLFTGQTFKFKIDEIKDIAFRTRSKHHQREYLLWVF